MEKAWIVKPKPLLMTLSAMINLDKALRNRAYLLLDYGTIRQYQH